MLSLAVCLQLACLSGDTPQALSWTAVDDLHLNIFADAFNVTAAAAQESRLVVVICTAFQSAHNYIRFFSGKSNTTTTVPSPQHSSASQWRSTVPSRPSSRWTMPRPFSTSSAASSESVRSPCRPTTLVPDPCTPRSPSLS
ncbi:hypothetical protein PR002_g1015 [Phytophthora rubi]|uniref:Uncharacterized protein n=1 Tax=Phytophthora rubi TaxID=129364 RepID=A0A6A3P4J9_9STRA|nr:hypothetical protein PR002_g1015 [Phytophthora rubi]